MAILQRFTAWYFAAKCAAVKFVKLWTLSHFSKSRDLSYVGSTTWRECLWKDWRGKSCWLHPRECGSKVDQGLRDMITSRTGPSRIGIDENLEIFRALLGLLPPATSLDEKWYENEWKFVDHLDEMSASFSPSAAAKTIIFISSFGWMCKLIKHTALCTV